MLACIIFAHMLTISQRGEQMPPSPIRKLVPFAEAAKKRGTQVYHLNIGQPDIPTPPSILDAVKHTSIKVLEYSHSAGNETYRRKLTGYYKKVGIDVSYDQIMITTGGSEAIMFGFITCLNPGDEVIIPDPFYANYNGFACAAGVKVVLKQLGVCGDDVRMPLVKVSKDLEKRILTFVKSYKA